MRHCLYVSGNVSAPLISLPSRALLSAQIRWDPPGITIVTLDPAAARSPIDPRPLTLNLPLTTSGLTFRPSSVAADTTETLYWDVSRNFAGNRIKSYGGFLGVSFSFEGSPETNDGSDVLLIVS